MHEILGSLAIPGLVASLFVGTWILRPLDVAASLRQRRVQFTVIDFLGLVFLLQLPMALINLGTGTSMPDDMAGQRLTLYILGWIATALVWWRCVVVFSHAGVTQARDRALTIFLVVPMAYLGIFSIPVLLVAAAVGGYSTLKRIVLIGVAVAVTFGVVSAGIVSRRVADRCESRQEAPDGTRRDPVLAELVKRLKSTRR